MKRPSTGNRDRVEKRRQGSKSDKTRLTALEFLHHDQAFGAVNKPGGVLTQAPPGIDSIECRARTARATITGAQHPYIGVPHRLDRPASGVLLLGWSRSATKKLAEQFERRAVDKTYWCVVAGQVPGPAGQWSDWMRKIPDQAQSEIVPHDHPDAQWAALQYRVLGQSRGLSWLRIELETGRTHQIRLQCASRGFPILGDDLYGSAHPFGPQVTDTRARWIALHARRLSCQSPSNPGPPLVITAPLFHHWEAFYEAFADMRTLDV
ncbi:MAG TPA: RNA pseudouridine synthase [Pirellulaceae bacterium]|nr:RNA pseudouridine synthase [Pirellulaceae bacterium]